MRYVCPRISKSVSEIKYETEVPSAAILNHQITDVLYE